MIWWLLEKVFGVKHPSHYLSFTNLEELEEESA
jgi:hypothetical protein